ncbi:MAG TPA: TIGR04282 family arsenosugar biosynthesis glycosyltransferase [Parvularculaceae bacterium]|nr:TIGR04282 family arsenosugar biosynthesis glycosyltransferase [Parvularculaceae bacterium]
MTRGTLIVFVKAPLAGRVKTRLAREIGIGRAAVLFRRMCERTIGEAAKGGWRNILAVDPPAALHAEFPVWPRHFERMAQVAGDLGGRMSAAIASVESGPVVVIGADAPGLRAAHLHDAFSMLGRADAVFGPAEDGGYWLIGLARRKPAPDLFKNVRWSSRDALADTIASLPRDFHVDYLPVLRDIDAAADLDAVGPILLSAR